MTALLVRRIINIDREHFGRMQCHLDPIGGVAGDMFIAALLDAFPDQEAGVRASIAAACFSVEVSCRLVPSNDDVLQGQRFVVEDSRDATGAESAVIIHPLSHSHHRDHRRHSHIHETAVAEVGSDAVPRHAHANWREIRAELEAMQLAAEIKRHAIAIFTLLADAEARVHGVAPDAVEFHEVGAWDSIADVVGAAHLIAALGATHWTVGPIPLGSGRIRTAHGVMPVPAPAVARLLEGFTTMDDGLPGERVTPTGAAIIRHVCSNSTPTIQPRVLRRSGIGFGTRTIPGLSNCLRILSFEEPAAPGAGHRELSVVEFEVDDQSGEDLAVGLERLRAHEAVFDVVQAPVFGKKGRMMTHVRLLSKPACLDDVIAACFRETTTIGLRHHTVGGAALRRRFDEIEVGGRTVRVKTVERPGGRTAKAEADDVAADGHAERSRLRRDAECLALANEWANEH
jgi:pyridinium-3,5-bisthiocarboxylic acid mononucleotide nickel chelatase